MNLQSLVVVALRLMALDFVLRIFIQIAPEVLYYARVFQPSRTNPISTASAVPWLVLGCLLATAIFLWFMAPTLARLLTSQGQFDVTVWSVDLTLADCYSVAFLGLGLLFVVNGLPQVLNWGHYFFKAAASGLRDQTGQQVNYYVVSQAVIPFIAGAVLVAKGRAWAVRLARRHQPPESANPTIEPTAAASAPRPSSNAGEGGSRGSS